MCRWSITSALILFWKKKVRIRNIGLKNTRNTFDWRKRANSGKRVLHPIPNSVTRIRLFGAIPFPLLGITFPRYGLASRPWVWPHPFEVLIKNSKRVTNTFYYHRSLNTVFNVCMYKKTETEYHGNEISFLCPRNIGFVSIYELCIHEK